MVLPSDTIAAIATAPGLGGIAILRISGPGAGEVLSRLFLPFRAQQPFSFLPRHMHFGHALDAAGEPLDEVLAVFMPGPHSATGEDVGEIHCHGGPGITAALLEAAVEAGARLAERGEFTRRAFLHGRMDLTQAEAVAELVSAPTRAGVRLAAAKLDGALGREVQALRAALDALRMQVTLAVDFPDEDAELLPREAFAETVREASAALDRLLNGFERARLWREGATAVLVGRVNAGKSSLLNALLGRERAIVSDLPGTTRDYIEESVNLGGMPLRLIDTAGLREHGDLVEREGIRRSRGLADEADLLLFVTDAREGMTREEAEFFQRYGHLAAEGRLFLILNKIDALPGLTPEQARQAGLDTGREWLAGIPQADGAGECCYAVSARASLGLDELSRGLRAALATLGGSGDGGDIAPNLRQSRLLRETRGELVRLEAALAAGHPPDILGVHLEAAAELLASVTGSASNEELLDAIFSSFCIGK